MQASSIYTGPTYIIQMQTPNDFWQDWTGSGSSPVTFRELTRAKAAASSLERDFCRATRVRQTTGV